MKKIALTNRFRRNIWGVIFALPATVLFAIFAAYPIFQTFYLGFFSYDLAKPKRFVGLDNYLYLLNDPVFKSSIINTFLYAIETYIPTLIIALALALVLNQKIPGRGFWRMLNFIPVVISWVIMAVIWKLLFHQNGLINVFLGKMGIPAVNWLLSEEMAPWAIVIPSIWKEVGFYMVIFLAGLQNIPYAYYEASMIDGASRLQSFRYITVPLLRPTLVLSIIISIINGLKVFTPQFVMTQGGPAGATRVMALIIYQTAFKYNRIGRAAAMSVILFIIILALTLIQNKTYGTEKR